jgi:D-alanyl-D-alanine carboxypeptidase (penicillin-binding protein 5/6)
MAFRPSPPRKKRRLKKRIIPLFLLVVLLVYVGWSLIASPKILLTPRAQALAAPATTALHPLAWPAYGQAAIGSLDGGLLTTNGAQTSVPIASIAKIMLALSLLREQPIGSDGQGDTLTLTQADVDIYNHYLSIDGSVALVAAQEQITEYQALQALLLPSANNFADTLANWSFGSVSNYVSYANNYAAQLGLTQTRFNDASGFDPGTVSSAADLVKLGQLALQNSVISDIVSQSRATIPVAGTIRNVNWLLSADREVIGIKTGNTDQAGGCMLFAAKHAVGSGSVTIIGAVLGAPNLHTALTDSRTLLNSAKQDFVNTDIVSAKQMVATYTTPWGESVHATTDSALSVVAWNGTKLSSQIVATPVRLPATTGQDVGKVVASGSTGTATKSVSIKLDGSVELPSLWWRLTHPREVL